MKWQRRVLVGAMIAVAISAVAAWVAVGLLADGVQQSLVRVDESLVVASSIATETADTLDEIGVSLGVIGDGLVSTSEALQATQDLSATVRDILSSIRFIDSVQQFRESLLEVEASLATVEADLLRADVALAATQEQLFTAADTVRDIPDALDASRGDLDGVSDQISDQVWWWRLAIVAAASAFVAVLWVIKSNLDALALLRQLNRPSNP